MGGIKLEVYLFSWLIYLVLYLAWASLWLTTWWFWSLYNCFSLIALFISIIDFGIVKSFYFHLNISGVDDISILTILAVLLWCGLWLLYAWRLKLEGRESALLKDSYCYICVIISSLFFLYLSGALLVYNLFILVTN